MADNSLLTALMRPFFRKSQTASFTVPGALSANSRLLCIDTGDLGDLVFHIPLLTAFKRRHPLAEIDFLVPDDHLELLVQSGLASECVVYSEGQLSPWRPAYGSLLRKLGAGSYDVAIVMSFAPTPRLELGALASGARLRLGPSHEDGWPSVNFEVRHGEQTAGYYGDRMGITAPFLGFSPAELKPGFPLDTDRVRHTAQQIHFHKPNPDQMLIGVDPGLSKGGHAFSAENLQFLVRQLSSQLVCKVVPVGDPSDRERVDRFATRLSEVPVGLPRETLLDMLLLVSQCDLFVAGNTDLFHFAVAMGVPAVGLFAENEDPGYRPAGRAAVRVIEVLDGEKVDIETLMEAVEGVTEGHTSTASTVISDPESHPSAQRDTENPTDA